MRDPFSGYDNWLEKPYQDMMVDSERFVDWAEDEGYNLDDPAIALTAENNYEDYIQGSAESRYEMQYEAYLDRLEQEALEMEDDWAHDGNAWDGYRDW